MCLTWILKNSCSEDLLNLREERPVVCRWWHALQHEKSSFRTWVVACVQSFAFLGAPFLPILLREMKNLSPLSEESKTRALDGVSWFDRCSDFKMSLFHFNLYFGLTMTKNLYISYIATQNYYCFDIYSMWVTILIRIYFLKTTVHIFTPLRNCSLNCVAMSPLLPAYQWFLRKLLVNSDWWVTAVLEQRMFWVLESLSLESTARVSEHDSETAWALAGSRLGLRRFLNLCNLAVKWRLKKYIIG